jgi:mono/diheme cytochrome c family protein
MERRKMEQPHIRTPDEFRDNLKRGKSVAGTDLYRSFCASCHQMNGKGDGSRFPPLVGSEWVTGNKNWLIRVLLEGLNDTINVNGVSYNGLMPAYRFLRDEEIAAVANYIRTKLNPGNDAIKPDEVKAVRKNLPQQ